MLFKRRQRQSEIVDSSSIRLNWSFITM